MARTLVCRRLATALLIVGVANVRPVRAQTAGSTGRATFFTPRDGAIAAGFLAATAGVSVFDPKIARFFLDTSYLHVRLAHHVDSAVTRVNETTLTLGGILVYGIARASKAHTVAQIAAHEAESVAAASLTSQVIRGPLGRLRPKDTDPPFSNQYDFEFLKGFTEFNRRAFPSIHSSSGFAAVSVLLAELHERRPKLAVTLAVPSYLLGLAPGLSRMYLGEHWASDIFAGAFMGTFYGWRVVQYSHAHGPTPVDRKLFPAAASWPAWRVGWDVGF